MKYLLELHRAKGGPYELQRASNGKIVPEYECYLKSDVENVVSRLENELKVSEEAREMTESMLNTAKNECNTLWLRLKELENKLRKNEK